MPTPEPRAAVPLWHVQRDGQYFGPYPEPALRAEARAGRLGHGALVSCGGPWLTVAQFLAARPTYAALGRVAASGPGAPGGTATAAPPQRFDPASLDAEVITATVVEEDGLPAVHAGTGLLTDPAGALEEPEYLGLHDTIPDRDRIVILGRRQSGKTVYLACVYARLWRALDGLTAKALTGKAHQELIDAHQMLRQGQWPAATLGTTQVELEIEHQGRKRLMVTMDFAGELFRRAFVEEQGDWPGVKELTHHIDRAAAVLLLIDPSVVAGLDHAAAMDDDFGIVQAVQRIRNWPGGDEVPVVLVLTKMDLHQRLLDHFGGAIGFVRHHFPALVRLMRKIPIFQVSAVQALPGKDGKLIPAPDSTPINLELPLRYCLGQIEQREGQDLAHQREQQRQTAATQLARQEEEAERRQGRNVILLIVAIALMGFAVIGLILWWRL